MKNRFGKKILDIGKVTVSLLYLLLFIIAAPSCSVSKQINKGVNNILLKDSVIGTGHIGISIYEPAINAYWYNYNATKYFVPASNTKLFTLYAGMKYLGDSLVGIYYQNFNDTSLNIFPAGDPTFLHPDFPNQPVLNFLRNKKYNIYISKKWDDKALGYGWSWDDYNDNYMVERSALPVYGNIVTFKINNLNFTSINSADIDWGISPNFFRDSINNYYSLPLKLQSKREIMDSSLSKKEVGNFSVIRNRSGNIFTLEKTNSKFTSQEIPFYVNEINTAIQILKKDFALNIKEGWINDNSLYPGIPKHLKLNKIKSQPSDSLFTPMMHNSDNFFAEQTLLMASNEHLGYMNDKAIIDTLLNFDLKDIPQHPVWVDGSGLSRYNLFTPQSFVYILNKMKNEFGLERLKKILPTGGEGTLKRYYNTDSNFIYAKTGSLSNQLALSGFLNTKKNKLLIFSVLANNVNGSAAEVRRAVERFLQGIRKKY